MSLMDEIMRSLGEPGQPNVRFIGPEELSRLLGDDEDKISQPQLDDMTSADMEDLATSVVAGAHNALLEGNVRKTMLVQAQAYLWLQVAAIRKRRESAQVD